MMRNEQPRILIVDDDPLNLDVLIECLKDEPYELVQAQDGTQALQCVRQDTQGFDAMILDRMMPGLTGLDVMRELKADESSKWMPVVMETSAASPKEICEGMESGVFFYLTKPFDQQVLIRIVNAAVEEGRKWRAISHNLNVQAKTLGCLQHGRFRIQTMDEAYDLALLIAQACPNPEKVAFGLNELIMNGVEHGNLQIGYDEKTTLQATDQWEHEISRRQLLPEYAERFVEILYERLANQIQITVIDQGEGFDWRDFEGMNPERLLESHGRGIAMAKGLSFDHLEYHGNGNHVVCHVSLDSKIPAEDAIGKQLVGKGS